MDDRLSRLTYDSGRLPSGDEIMSAINFHFPTFLVLHHENFVSDTMQSVEKVLEASGQVCRPVENLFSHLTTESAAAHPPLGPSLTSICRVGEIRASATSLTMVAVALGVCLDHLSYFSATGSVAWCTDTSDDLRVLVTDDANLSNGNLDGSGVVILVVRHPPGTSLASKKGWSFVSAHPGVNMGTFEIGVMGLENCDTRRVTGNGGAIYTLGAALGTPGFDLSEEDPAAAMFSASGSTPKN